MAFMDARWIKTLDFVKRRRYHYQLTFAQPAGQNVLDDLAKFCRAHETCVIPGDRDRSLVLEGRREVWLRIMQHMAYSPEQLMVLFGGTTSED